MPFLLGKGTVPARSKNSELICVQFTGSWPQVATIIHVPFDGGTGGQTFFPPFPEQYATYTVLDRGALSAEDEAIIGPIIDNAGSIW